MVVPTPEKRQLYDLTLSGRVRRFSIKAKTTVQSVLKSEGLLSDATRNAGFYYVLTRDAETMAVELSQELREGDVLSVLPHVYGG
jgi:molybdopterin converting factor small subunit